MRIVIPMAGYGNRFKNAGYKDPKPLINVCGKRIIEYVLDSFNKDLDDFIFICNTLHTEETRILETLKSLVNNCSICIIDNHKKGPVWTVSQCHSVLDTNDPIIFSYCDSPFIWNYDSFKNYAIESNIDGCLVTHSGFHPHNLCKGIMAHCKLNGNRVVEVKEKGCFTDDPMNEHASSGAYYFKSGRLAKEYFKKTIEENVSFNNEYYITLVYNLMIKDGLNITSYLCDSMVSFGTPTEIENYVAWKTIIDSQQCSNETDILNCYKFWKKIHMK